MVDARQLEWRERADEQLKAVVTGSIQLVAVRARAAAAGIDPAELVAIVAPVLVTNVELGQVEGRSPDDETAAFLMTMVLFFSIGTFGAMVLSGVVEEKSSRTVEVLLARNTRPRSLLAGKIAGIGLLGLVQIAATAIVALVAASLADSFDAPAVRGSVIAWAVVWFVLGYALYATVFGTLGSLASRTEDASSVAGPVSIILVLGFIVSFAAIGSADTTWAQLVSWFPATAPLAMPNRIAMSVASGGILSSPPSSLSRRSQGSSLSAAVSTHERSSTPAPRCRSARRGEANPRLRRRRWSPSGQQQHRRCQPWSPRNERPGPSSCS